MAGYVCSHCGQYHDGLPMSYGALAPALWFAMSEAEQKKRCELDDETCVIRGQPPARETHYFIKGNIEIPVRDAEGNFVYTVWVSLSEKNFGRALSLWKNPRRVEEPAYFGWLSTSLPGYPDTLHLKTMVHTREVGMRPYVELQPTSHPLAVEQREGITMKRIQEIAELILHHKD